MISNLKHEPKRNKMSSNDSVTETVEPIKPAKSKNKLKSGTNTEIKDKNLDKIFHNNNLRMPIATQIISNDQTVRSDTVQDIKDFKSQSLATQFKKGERLVAMMPRAFNLLGDDIVELSTENGSLKNENGSYHEK